MRKQRLWVVLIVLMFLQTLSFAFMRNIGIGVDIRKTYTNEAYSDYKINLNADTQFGYGYVLYEKELGISYIGYNVVVAPFRDKVNILIEADMFHNDGRKMDTTSFRFGMPLTPFKFVFLGLSINNIDNKDSRALAVMKVELFDMIKLVMETNGNERTVLDLQLGKDFPLTDRLYFSPVTTFRQINTEYYWQILGNLKLKLGK